MKKVVYFVVLIAIILVAIIALKISDNNSASRQAISFNKQFERYKDTTIYGTDVLTIINKAIDNNEKYEIERNQEGFYIENDENSLKVELILLLKNEENMIIEKTYQMESLEKAGLKEFISSFNLTEFRCENIEYNSKNRISKITVKQLEI